MNQQERDALRVHWESFRQHRTHFLDCYKWHPECAVICVLDAWEAEPVSLEVASRVYHQWVDSQWETDVPPGFQGAL